MVDFSLLEHEGKRGNSRCDIMHAPLQELGGMLIRSTRNRIPRCEKKRVCACWCNVELELDECFLGCTYSCIHVQAREKMLN